MELRSISAGVVILLAGLIVEVWRRKLKFDRTNSAGVEEFSSFRKKLFAEWLDTMLYLAFLALSFGGLFIILISY
jgi:hypothetical protein